MYCVILQDKVLFPLRVEDLLCSLLQSIGLILYCSQTPSYDLMILLTSAQNFRNTAVFSPKILLP